MIPDIFPKIIKLIPKKIKTIIDNEAFNSLEEEVENLLDQLDLYFDGRWIENKFKNFKIIATIAAIDYYLRFKKEYIIVNNELPYWCWKHHEAFEITETIISLFAEPLRTEAYKEIYDYKSNYKNKEIQKTINQYIKFWWKNYQININYPCLNLYNEDTNPKEEYWEFWDLSKIYLNKITQENYLTYYGRDTNNMFGTSIPLDEEIIIFPSCENLYLTNSILKINLNNKIVKIWENDKKEVK